MTYVKHDDDFVEMYETEQGIDEVTFWQLCYLVQLFRCDQVSRRAQPEHVAWDAVNDLKKFKGLRRDGL